MKVDVIVLAGADNKGELREVSPARYEALIEIAGRPMFTYVVDALLASESVGRVVLVGPSGELDCGAYGERVEPVERGSSMVENIERGLEFLRPKGMVLICTSDIPLLTPEALDDFIERCKGTDADIYYPIVSREDNERQFPGVRRTYVTLKDGVYTGGNFALLDPGIVDRSHHIIEQAVAMRKKPVQLSRLLGFKFIVKFIFRQISLAEIERRIELTLGFKGVGIRSLYPEIGIDVDKVSDFNLISQLITTKDEVERSVRELPSSRNKT